MSTAPTKQTTPFEGSATTTIHADGATFSARYSDAGRDRAGLIGNVDLDTLLDWLRSRLS